MAVPPQRICRAISDTAIASRRDIIRHGAGALILLGMPTAACAQADTMIDLFTEISDRDLPAEIGAIRTRGWRTPGIGAARYVFDTRVDRNWVAKFPGSAAITANGRGFRLEGVGGDVRQYGAFGDGRADDTAAINEALMRGGTILLAGPAIYRVTDRLLISVARTRLLFDKDVTLRTRAWRYQGSQTPFGNAIHITSDDCEVLGAGPTSVLENFESDANGIGFLHCGGGRVAHLTLKGGKEGLTAIVDDTFQSGISIVNDHINNLGQRPSKIVIEDCSIIGWIQYGINIYGDLARDIIVRRTHISQAGNADDKGSVGAGIALTRGIGPVLVNGNTISGNKGYGIFISSAGAEVRDVTVSQNQILDNGLDGIRASEERNFGGADAIGLCGVTISNNRIEGNGAVGVRVGTYDGIGSVKDMAIVRNRIIGNRGSGILLQANDIPGRDVSAIVEKNELIGNGEYGLAVGLNRITLRHRGNRFERNRSAATIDYRGKTPQPLVEG